MPVSSSLIPLRTFLHRVFPAGDYPDDGATLAAERIFRPRRGSPEVRIEVPLDWNQPDNPDRNWRMQVQGWTMFHPIMNVFDGLSNKQQAVDYFFDVLCDWWEQHGDDPEDIVTTRTPDNYAWYDMSVGFRALVLAFFMNRISCYRIHLEAAEASLLDAVVNKHANHLRNPSVLYPNNHGIFQIHGLRGLAETADYVEQQSDKDYAETSMADLLISQFDVHGIHREHSPHYHIFALRTFEDVFSSGWYEHLSDIGGRMEAARSAVPWLVDPLRRPAAVGDSIPTVQTDLELPAPLPENRNGIICSDFNASGYAVARSNWDVPPESASYLFFMAGYHSKTHKHRDCLSFEWFDGGYKRLTDSGKYGYYGDAKRRYVLSARAHNVVEIEGLDILKMSPYGSAIRSSQLSPDGIYRVIGELAFKAINHKRELHLRPGHWLVVDDHFEFNRDREATQWFHIALGHRLVSSTGRAAIFKGPDGRLLSLETLDHEAELVLKCGDSQAGQGFVSENDDHIEPGYVVGFRSMRNAGRTSTAIGLGPEDLDDAVTYAARELGAGEWTPRFGRAPTWPIVDVPHWLARGVHAVDVEPGTNSYHVASQHGSTNLFSAGDGGSALLVVLDGKSLSIPDLRDGVVSLGLDSEVASVIAIADPTLASHTSLEKGWFLGPERGDGVELAALLVSRFQEARGVAIDQIVLIGVGPGAFAALKVGERFSRAPVVVIDPELPRDGSTQLTDVLRCVFSEWTLDQARLVFGDRLRLSRPTGSVGEPAILIRSVPDDDGNGLRPFPTDEEWSGVVSDTHEVPPTDVAATLRSAVEGLLISAI